MITSPNASGPLALAGADGPSTEVERAGPPTRLAANDSQPAAVRQSREVIRVNVATGKALRYELPTFLEAPYTSGHLTEVEQLLLHDAQLPAAYNQTLAVIAASAIVERGTAETVPVLLAKLLLQELDRANALLAVQSRRIGDLIEARSQHGPATR